MSWRDIESVWRREGVVDVVPGREDLLTVDLGSLLVMEAVTWDFSWLPNGTRRRFSEGALDERRGEILIGTAFVLVVEIS